MAADHLGRSSPLFLYPPREDPHPGVRTRDQFVRLARYIATKTVASDSLLLAPSEQTVGSIGNLLYELFKNTHDHARTDIRGRPLSHSYRLFQAATLAQRKTEFELMSSGFPPLADFYSSLRPTKDREFVNVFLLSVLDSGPGYAQTWTREEAQSSFP